MHLFSSQFVSGFPDCDPKQTPHETTKLISVYMNNVSINLLFHINLKKKFATCVLKKPIVAGKDDRITISRRVGDRFRLVGYGLIKE